MHVKASAPESRFQNCLPAKEHNTGGELAALHLYLHLDIYVIVQ